MGIRARGGFTAFRRAVDVCISSTPWQPNHPLGAILLLGPSLYPSRQVSAPLYPSGFPQPAGAAWPSGVPWPPICLTGVGVRHHGGQVPALAHVHRHVGSVLADDVAGLAGVHGIHLVAAAGPCGGGKLGSLRRLKVLHDAAVLEAKRKARPVVPILGIK